MLTQLQFINLLLSKKDASLIINNGLTAEWFPQLKNEFNFIYNHFKNYNQIPDIETFLKAFPEFEVIEVSESIDYLLNELYREKNENFLVGSFNKMRELLVAGKTEEAMDYLNKASDKASANRQLEAIDILDDTSRYEAYLDKCNDFGKYYVSTGLKELDQIIGGYDRNEELAVISARSGTGKSWMLLKSITASVNRGLNVGLFSGEMSVNKVGYRFDTLMGHISNGKLIHGNIDVSNDYRKYLDELKNNHKGHLYVLTPDNINGDATVDALRSFIEKYNLDILFIDQHSLLVDHSYARTSFEKAANISKDLKYLQTIKRIPIISAVQQNRSAIEEGKSAGTENIAQSDRIAQDATLILFLSVKDNILTVNIGKSRDGGSFKQLNYAIDYNKGMFGYLPAEDEPATAYQQEEQEFSPMNMPNYEIDSDALPF